MPEEKVGGRVRLGDVFGSPQVEKDSTPIVNQTDFDKLLASLAQKAQLKNWALVSEMVDGGGGNKQMPIPDIIEQVTKLTSAIGPNYNAMLKSQGEALVASETARTESEKRIADLRYQMISKEIDGIRAESQTTLRNIEEIIKKNQQQPGQTSLFGLADQATGGEYTKQFLAKTFGPQTAPSPREYLLGILTEAEELKKMLGINQITQERVPLSESPEYQIEVLKDKRLTKIEEQKLELEKGKAATVNKFFESLPNIISDGIAAWGARRGGGEHPAPVQSKTTTQPQAAAVEYIPINCPNPACGKSIPWLKDAPAGSIGECPYCHVAFSKDDEEEKTA